MEFDTDEARQDDEDNDEEDSNFASPDTHELDLTDGHTDTVEMERIERPDKVASNHADLIIGSLILQAETNDSDSSDDDGSSSDSGENKANQV